MHKENKRRRLAIEEIQSMVRKRPRSQSVATAASQDPVQTTMPVETGAIATATLSQPSESPTAAANMPQPEPQAPVIAAPEPTDESLSPPTAEGIFDNIRSQYMEALYHSMVRSVPSRNYYI